MNWKVNEIVRVEITRRGKLMKFEPTFRILEIKNGQVIAIPAMEEAMQASAAAFVGDEYGTIDDATFTFDAVTGEQVIFTELNKILGMKFKINKIIYT